MKVKHLIHGFRQCVCLVLALVLAGPVTLPTVVHAQSSALYEDEQLLKGDVLNLAVRNLQRVSVTDPSIADISEAKADQVDLIGKSVGQTVLFIWDADGKRTIMIHVIDQDLALIKDRTRSLLASSGIEGIQIKVNAAEGKLVLTGTLSDEKMTIFNKAIEPVQSKIINFVQKENNEDLVQIDMQVTELSTTLERSIGVDWTDANKKSYLTYNEALPEATGNNEDLFKIGSFSRTVGILATVNALIKEGKGRILSKPRLMVVNGKDANFRVGGEVPIKTETYSTGSGTNTTITTTYEYKEYGITMNITPTIRNGQVSILLRNEIKDVDRTNFSTDGAVAFTTRSAQTQLLLDDQQTVVLAGLIKKTENNSVSRVPVLSKLPLVGLLFKNSATLSPNQDSEIVISLTPTIIHVKTKTPPVMVEPAIVPEPPPMDLPDGRNRISLPVITKNSAGVSISVPLDVKNYAVAVQRKLATAITYPMEATANRWQGTVKLGLIIRKDGSLRDVYIAESSGYDAFDHDAQNTARVMSPYEPFPGELREEQITVTIPIVYSTDAFLKNVAKRN